MIEFSIPGVPASITAQSKGVKVIKGTPIFFTKSPVKEEELRLKNASLPHAPKHPLEGPIVAELTYVFAMNKGECEAHFENLADDEFLIWKTKKPDADNAAKLLVDVLTKAGFWNDDSQISELFIHKRAGSLPRIDVTIARAEDMGIGLGTRILPLLLAALRQKHTSPAGMQ